MITNDKLAIGSYSGSTNPTAAAADAEYATGNNRVGKLMAGTTRFGIRNVSPSHRARGGSFFGLGVVVPVMLGNGEGVPEVVIDPVTLAVVDGILEGVTVALA